MRHFNSQNLKKTIQYGFKTVSLFLFSVLLTLSAVAQNFTVNTTNDTHAANLTTGDDGTGHVSFRSALEAANNLGGTQAIVVPAGTYNLTLGMIIMNDKAENIAIIGAGAATTIVHMTTTLQGRILLIGTTGTQANMVTTINNMQFTGGNLTSDDYGGGAIIAGGPLNRLTLQSCIFQNNTVPVGNGSGGAVRYNGGGTLSIDNCTFNNNSDAAADGGAVSYFLENLVSAGNGSVSITNSTFTNNTVTNTAVGGSGGGAIYVSAQGRINAGVTFSVSILKNTFTGNTANAPGGAGGAIRINNGFDVGNTAQVHYNRIVNNTSIIAPNGLVSPSAQGNVDANDNWWGCNTGPNVAGACNMAAIGGSGGVGTLTTTTWLRLQTTASPNPICNTSAGLGNTSNVTTSFLNNSAGDPVTLNNLVTLINRPVTWSSTLGNLSSQQGTIQANGEASALFTSNGTGGTATVNAVVDNLTATETSPSRANITVHTLPTVTNPVNTTVCRDGTATFTSTITGVPAPTIHWRIGTTDLVDGPQASGSTISGAGTATLTITNVQAGDAVANYNVQAANECGTANSTDAALTVNIPSVAPTSISGTNVYCNPGSTTLTAEGGTLGTAANYQWGTGSVVGASPLPGQTASTLTVSPTATTTYWVQIENTASPCTINTGGPTQVVTVNQPSVAPSGISGTTTICSGSPTTLTATGGILGTGANYQWGTGAGVGTSPLIGETNSTLTVSPSSTATYWVRIENTASPCTTTTDGVTQVVTVYQPSIAPSGITGNTTICNGGSTTLAVTGGTLGTDAHYQWGTGNVVGTSPLTGETSSTLTVSPTSNTTYWVRIENTASPCTANTTGVTQSVAVNQLSIAPTGATGSTSICNGGSTILTVAGGIKGTGATTEWFTGSCGGIPAGTGDAITVSPSTNTTYFVRYNGTCNTTTCAIITVNITSTNSIILTSATGTDAQAACINTPITTITYATTGATGANFSGLPAGVSGSWSANVATINGSPSSSGISNYTVTLTGGCGNVSIGGSITVNPVPTVTTPTITQPTCAAPAGTIVVNASGTGTLEYSINGGANWFISNTFSPGAGNYTIAVRSQNFPACVTNYSGNPVALNAATGCTVPPTITCPTNITTTAASGQCSKSVSFSASATGVPAPTIVYKIGAAVITSPYTFPVGTTTVNCRASNGTLPDATCSFTVTVNDDQPPVIHTITNPIVLLWSPNHKYQTITVSQFVASVTDNCGNIPVGNVVITKVTSDEADDAPGNGDGNTTQDIKIASDCKSVDLRSERMDGGNGRVYTIYFFVNDGKGNTATATATAIVAPNQSGTTAIDNGPVYTVNGSCNTGSFMTQTQYMRESITTVKPEGVTVQNHPNPFSSFTTIRYWLPAEAQVSLAVYNSLGQRVAHLVNGRMSAGEHAVRFEASDRTAGIYLYTLKTTDAEGKPVVFNGKMVIAK